jgi:hypothetical protein
MSRSSPLRLLLVALLAAALGATLALWLRPSGQPAAAPPSDTPPASPTLAPTPAAPAPEPAPPPSSAASAPLLEGDAAHEAIADLAVTYDPAAVPDLARYLAHPDPEIRSAARDGLVQLGERAAIAPLEAAASRAADPDEASSLREAARFLSLPTWTEHRARTRSQATPTGSSP